MVVKCKRGDTLEKLIDRHRRFSYIRFLHASAIRSGYPNLTSNSGRYPGRIGRRERT